MLEVEFESSSFTLDLDEIFKVALEGKVPFKTKLTVWKEEVYFSTPVEIDVSNLKGQLRVKKGMLFYWPLEKSFCIFYGISQPYSPVYQIGLYIGLLSKLKAVKDGVEATVKIHKIHEPYSSIIDIIKPLGFKVSTPLHEGERVIEAVKYVKDVRVALRIHVEDYGIYIEGEPILPRERSPETIRLVEKVDSVVSRGRYSRLDLSEEGWITITSFAGRGEREIFNAINEMSEAYCKVAKSIKIQEYL
ncbi:MAG: cyclophilin-like family protein [Candidatus Bathyarchaeia archaeon]|nr:hypothetical protein [Candidatus Bathyarchaeota archaeon]